MKVAVIISTLLNVLLLLVLLFAAVGIVMGLASFGSLLAQVLLYAYYLFFVVPVISIIGSWLNYKKGNEKMMFRFIALTWEYLLLYIIGLLALLALEK